MVDNLIKNRSWRQFTRIIIILGFGFSIFLACSRSDFHQLKRTEGKKNENDHDNNSNDLQSRQSRKKNKPKPNTVATTTSNGTKDLTAKEKKKLLWKKKSAA